MDLGATVCRPGRPLCDTCPITSDCAALATGAPETYPRRTLKASRPHRHGVAYKLIVGGEIGLVQRPPRGLLGGMVGLPTSEWRAAPFSDEEALAGAPVGAAWRAIGVIEHVFTHFSLSLAVWEARAASKAADLLWTRVDQVAASLPSVFKKALRLNPPGSP
jgi:A/G-specific adenine glycosylase